MPQTPLILKPHLSHRALAFTLLFLAAFGTAARADKDRSDADRPAWNEIVDKDRDARRGAAVVGEQDADDPDLPNGLGGPIDKGEYLQMRDHFVATLRGFSDDMTTDERQAAAQARGAAIEGLNRVDEVSGAFRLHNRRPGARTSVTAWTPLGPAPIPNGQTTTVSQAVSGRVTAIAIHPTDPNTVYVGTAQGGVYRTLDGGATWTPIFDSAQSLAIGSLAIDPLDPTILFVGTGEGNLSLDSFFGVGLYRINNADTTPVLYGPFETRVAGLGYTAGNGHAFLGTSIVKILVDPTNDNRIFVGNTIGGAGFDGAGICCGGTTPASAFISLWFCENAQSTVAGTPPVFSRVPCPATANGYQAVTDMVFEPGNTANLLVGMYDFYNATGTANLSGLYRSTNANTTSIASNVAPTFTRVLASTTGTGASTKYLSANLTLSINKVGTTVTVLAALDKSSGSLYKSTDGGATFGAAIAGATGFAGGQGFYDMAPALDPNNAGIIYLGGSADSTSSGVLKKSTNGTTFANSDTGLHADTHVVAIAPSNTSVIYTGDDGGVFRSNDSGASWNSLNNTGLNATQFTSIALHPTDRNFTLGGSQDNGTELQKADGTWTRADFGDGGFALIDQNATDTTNVTMYHTYYNSRNALLGLARVDATANAQDNGWAFYGYGGTANGIGSSNYVNFYAPIALGPGNPNTVYYGSDRLYRSTNKGVTMTVVSQAPFVSTVPISAIGISPQDDNVRLVGLNSGKVYATSTGASPLTDVTGSIPAKYVTRAVIDPNNKTTAYITLSGYGLAAGAHVWKTTNMGSTATWTASGAGIPDVPVDAFVVDPANSNHLFAGTDIAVYQSNDGGASWSVFGTGLPRVAVFDMGIQKTSNILRVATHGRGMWEIYASNPIPVAVPPVVTTVANTPVAITLGGSDPDGETISFSVLSQPAHGTLSGTAPNLTYTPAQDYTGSDSFTYSVGDPNGTSLTATVTINVSGVVNVAANLGPSALLSTQTLPTAFGDNLSEMDQLFARPDGQGNLLIGITGNLEVNTGNGIVLLLDTKSGGSNTFNYTGTGASGRVTGLNGDTLDTGFAPDYALDTNFATSGVNKLFVDFFDLQANTHTFLGSNVDAAGALTGGGLVSFVNTNAAGVTDASATGATTATNGLYLKLPLSQIGSPTGAIKLMALITGNGGYVSNQTLPGLPDTYGNLGNGPSNFNNYPGRQYATLNVSTTASDLAAGTVQWTYTPVYLSGNSNLDAHPPVTSVPTIVNGRAYVVEDVVDGSGAHTGRLAAVDTTSSFNGALVSSFGSSGRIALDAPATGRVSLRQGMGGIRLYLVTTKGTVYMMDAATGANLVSINPLVAAGLATTATAAATSASTPAISVDADGTPQVYVSLRNTGTNMVYVAKVSDTLPPLNTQTPLSLLGATDATSPSVIANGTRVQIGSTGAGGGNVYTVQSADLTVFNAATTAFSVKAPPTLSKFSDAFFVGDTDGTNGNFYSFNASTANPIAAFGSNGIAGISGGVEQAAFLDYLTEPQVSYVGTTAGKVYAMATDTGLVLSGFPQTLPGAPSVTGSPTLLKPSIASTTGNLYVPTANGLFVLPTGTPTAITRFPAPAGIGSVSASGRAAGSVLAGAGDNGNVYGLVVQ